MTQPTKIRAAMQKKIMEPIKSLLLSGLGGRAVKVMAFKTFRPSPLIPLPVIIAPIILKGKMPPIPKTVPCKSPPKHPKIMSKQKQRTKPVSGSLKLAMMGSRMVHMISPEKPPTFLVL